MVTAESATKDRVSVIKGNNITPLYSDLLKWHKETFDLAEFVNMLRYYLVSDAHISAPLEAHWTHRARSKCLSGLHFAITGSQESADGKEVYALIRAFGGALVQLKSMSQLTYVVRTCNEVVSDKHYIAKLNPTIIGTKTLCISSLMPCLQCGSRNRMLRYFPNEDLVEYRTA